MTDLEREQQLDAILTAYLQAVDDGHEPDRTALLTDHPDLAAELREFFDEQERLNRLTKPLRPAAQAACLNGLETADPLDTPHEAVAHALGIAVGSFGDYELLQEIGRGGMGVVYKVRQKSLNRLIALKMIRSTDLANEAEVRRFRNEAETAALLDHPNIVPIYEVGELRGHHYFSMKLIEGGSLAEAVVRGEGSVGSKEEQRRAARLLVTIARAVHHAHQRGVLHRDLKPSNILLDAGGAPHVTDFGLARRVEIDSNLTQSGELVGTPSYMAPEQASGRKAEITTATDVYGLGAVLYTLLAGCPPFRAETVLETLEEVKGREPKSPCSGDRRVDHDLETICLKCLDKEPARRYPSADAFAADLEHWMAGEPIKARPLGCGTRALRWCRRNPVVSALAALAVLLLLLVVVGLAISTVLISRKETQAQAAYKAEMEQHKRAEANFQAAERQRRLAREIVDKMYIQFVAKWLDNQPQMSDVQKTILQSALDYYREFAKAQSTDPKERMQIGGAYLRIAKILQFMAISDKGAARNALLQARDVFQKLVDDFPEEADFQYSLAFTYEYLAFSHHSVLQEEEKYLRQSVQILEQIVAKHPGNAEYRRTLAGSLLNFGNPLSYAGRWREAKAAYARTAALYEELKNNHEASVNDIKGLATASLSLAGALHAMGELEAALQLCRRGVATYEELGTTSSGLPEYEHDLNRNDWHNHGKHYTSLAMMLEQLGKCKEAMDAVAHAVRIHQKLAADFPQVLDYKEMLFKEYILQGQTLWNCDRSRESEVGYRQAFEVGDKVLAEFDVVFFEAHPTKAYFVRCSA